MELYKKRVLLINSNNPYPNEGVNRYLPLGLLYLSSCLISDGYEVKVEDVQNNTMGLNRPEFDEYFKKTLLGIIESFEPDIVGIGVLFSLRFKSALSIIDLVKKVRPDLPIVIGGAHATLFPGQILHDHHKIDYCVLSEGEKSFPELLKKHFDDHTAFSEIDGIAYRNNGQIQVNPKTQYIENLDEIEFPAYHLVNIEDYFFDTTNWHNPKSMDINYNSHFGEPKCIVNN
jgi:anaerobic magnesium-protoporphyrin IX monomethyl ester cyclase